MATPEKQGSPVAAVVTKPEKPEKQEKILSAVFNTIIVLPKLGQYQTIAVEKNGPIEHLGAHPIGLAIHMKGVEEFFVIPWANIGSMKLGMR